MNAKHLILLAALITLKIEISVESVCVRPTSQTSNVPDTTPELLVEELLSRLRNKNAKAADIRVSLAWNSMIDLDLHVIEPSGEKIYWEKKISNSGGELEFDMNDNENILSMSNEPIESVYWPVGTQPVGHYKIEVVYYANNGLENVDPINYLVLVTIEGINLEFRGKISKGDVPNVWEFSYE
jgi:hypothetical protein